MLVINVIPQNAYHLSVLLLMYVGQPIPYRICLYHIEFATNDVTLYLCFQNHTGDRKRKNQENSVDPPPKRKPLEDANMNVR